MSHIVIITDQLFVTPHVLRANLRCFAFASGGPRHKATGGRRCPPKTIVSGGTGTVGALEAPQTITENPLRQGFSAHRCEGRGVESDAGPRDLFGVAGLRVQVSRGRVPFLLRCYGCRP